jgi:hypothetical protein
MKYTLKIFVAALLMFLIPMGSNAQFLKKVTKTLNSGTATGLTENDAVAGIKEALIQGTNEGVSLLSVVDGYFGNPEIKIPFPKDAGMVESRLRAVGLGSEVDKAILSINRAAEDAAKEAKPIFVSAITGMSISDAIGIVKGNDNAATQYLRKTTTTELAAKFKPVIKTSLDKVNATKYWTDLINTYNKIPMVQKMNPDLAAYVTDQAINGLFVMIAKEEQKIRKDPVARTTELLKKVFANP